MTTVTNKNGYELEFDMALMYMDDDIVEKLNIVMPYDCSEQGFFTVYEHEHEKATGEEWFLSSENPCY